MSVNSEGNVYVSYLRDNGSSGNIFTDIDTDKPVFCLRRQLRRRSVPLINAFGLWTNRCFFIFSAERSTLLHSHRANFSSYTTGGQSDTSPRTDHLM